MYLSSSENYKSTSAPTTDEPKTHTHGNRGRRPIPTRRQFVRLILLQVVDNDDGTIRLIPVFSKLGPSDLSAIVAEDRGMRGTVFPRGDLLSIPTLEVDDVDLETPN